MQHSSQLIDPQGVFLDEAAGVSYRVLGFLGRGGMGEVHEVEREGTGERFALKCLQAHLTGDAKAQRRASSEAMALRELQHPNVVRVHAAGVREDGLIWMVMDRLYGYTLRDLLDLLSKLPVPWALKVARDAAYGLSAVHAFAVHRDIKPENIHIGHDAIVRVLDLGAGKFHHLGITTTGTSAIGTVPYMSPEQIEDPSSIDARSDVFSLGVVLFELLAGKHPHALNGFDKENVFSIVRSIITSEPARLGEIASWVPEPVIEVVERAMKRDRSQRYDSAASLSRALGQALATLERASGPAAPLSTLTSALGLLGPFSARVRVKSGEPIDGDASTAMEPAMLEELPSAEVLSWATAEWVLQTARNKPSTMPPPDDDHETLVWDRRKV